MQHTTRLSDAELTLRPLQKSDIAPLCALAAANAGELRHLATRADQPEYYHEAIQNPRHLAFVVEVAGKLAGCTRYGDINREFANTQLGWTWLDAAHHGTGINRRMKRLMLRHAFEEMQMERVYLRTDILNTRSQRAIEKLGATKEGVLRRDVRRPDGTLRDTVVYSILREEWPSVKAGLWG